jgi:phage FluMu protein Com
MAIQFKCGDCGADIAVRDGSGGRSVRCPKCQKVQVIPGDAAGPAAAASDFSTAQGQGDDKGPRKPPCPICGTPTKPGKSCPKCSRAGAGRVRPPSEAGRNAWKFITVGIVLALAGGLIYAFMWTLKQAGQAGGDYAQTLVDARTYAQEVTCKENLANLQKTLAIFRQAEQRSPTTLHELIERNYAGPENLRCPKTKTDFIYIPGQTEKDDPQNVVVYEPDAPHAGKAFLLRLSGQIDCLTADQLKAEVEATQKRLRQ